MAVGVVVEIGHEPFLGFGDRHSFAAGVVFDLVAFDFSDGEIFGFGVGEIESAHAAAGEHGEAFGEGDAGGVVHIEEFPDLVLWVNAPPSSSISTSSPVTVLITSGPVMNIFEVSFTMTVKSVRAGE